MMYDDINHVAIILDGNRRWAKRRHLPSLEGHRQGCENLFNLTKFILNTSINYLSVFAFSTENFKRTEKEVKYLMDLFAISFKKHVADLDRENIKVVFSGIRDNLRQDVVEMMEFVENKTINNTKGVLNICLNYGGHLEILEAVKKINIDINNNKINIDDLNDNLFNKYLFQDLPPIDLLIRTSGEERISNFMLWQLAYAELYFTPVMFPDFNELEFNKAVNEYNKRNRRFGGDSHETENN